MRGKKRIAFLCHPYHRGGVTRWMADAAIAFAHAGWETYFITPGPSAPFVSGAGRETMLELLSGYHQQIRIVTQKVGFEFEFGTYQYRTYIYQKLLRSIPIGTPVIVSDDGAVWNAAAAAHVSHPMIGVLHSDHHDYYDLAIKYCKKTDVLSSVSCRIQKKVIALLGDKYKGNTYMIPCGINMPSFSAATHKNEKLELVYTARLVKEAKRLGDLPKLCKELTDHNISFHLHIIGDGPEREGLETDFAQSGLSGVVTFYGWMPREEVQERMNISDMVILTSDFEGLPIVMMEGLAAGCAFAGTRVSGIEDYEKDGFAADCYRVFDVGDIATAAIKIQELASIPADKRRNAARAIAEANFSMAVCIERYDKVIAAIPKRAYADPVVAMSPFKRLLSHIRAYARYMKIRTSKAN